MREGKDIMELKFVGIGSAFNTKLFNTSGFFKKENNLFLIDCGGTVFRRLQELNLIQGVKKTYIIITHTHPDHVGSLGDLMFYCNYILKHKPMIITPNKEGVEKVLCSVGVDNTLYTFENLEKLALEDNAFGNINIEFIKVTHSKSMLAYGFIINIDGETIYYSGDCNSISDYVLNKLKAGEISKVYQDTCGADYPGNGHMSLNKLKERIPEEFRSKVWCMHLDENISEEQIKSLGFYVATLTRLEV